MWDTPEYSFDYGELTSMMHFVPLRGQKSFRKGLRVPPGWTICSDKTSSGKHTAMRPAFS